jgi:putative ABC transport system substrate-binding protein
MGVELLSLEVRDRTDLAGALDSARRWPAEALMTSSGPVFSAQLALMVEFPAANHLPAIYYTREYAEAGGLMSYGPSWPGLFRQAAGLMAKILGGAKPADLPVEQPTKFDFVINLTTAQALGLDIPQSILLQTTDVIR